MGTAAGTKLEFNGLIVICSMTNGNCYSYFSVFFFIFRVCRSIPAYVEFVYHARLPCTYLKTKASLLPGSKRSSLHWVIDVAGLSLFTYHPCVSVQLSSGRRPVDWCRN